MLIDCHLHTRDYSPCSVMEAEELAARAQATGLDAIVITDHHSWWPLARLDALRDLFPGLAIYNGAELTLEEGYDVVVIGPPLAIKPYPSLKKLRKALASRRDEYFLFVAHAFRWNPAVTAELLRVLPEMDGMEINSVNILRGNARRDNGRYLPINAELYELTREEHQLTPLYNTDGHRLEAVGSIANALSLPRPPEDERALARALREQLPRERQALTPLRHILETLDR